MLSPTDWNWAGKTAFFYAGLTAVLAVFMFFMLPEPMGRSYAELDVLFENKISARKFHKINVDQFSGHNTEIRVDSGSDTAGSDNDTPKAYRKEKEEV